MRKLIDDFIQDCKETIDELLITTMNDVVIGDIKLSIKVYDEKCGLALSLHSPDYDGQVYVARVLTITDDKDLVMLLIGLQKELNNRDQTEVIRIGELNIS